MIIKLFQPPTNNWLLIAEQLDDPSTWDRFLPCHTSDSQRWKFDCIAKELAGNEIRLKPCKELLKRGRSVFEYDWNIDENDILAHAMQVAEALGLDLLIAPPSTSDGPIGRTAA